MKIIVLSLLIILTNSCALILTGSKAKIFIPQGEPKTASVYMGDSLIGVTPTSFKIEKNRLGKDVKIQIRAEGFEPLDVEIFGKFNAGALFFDIIFGVIWIVVDASSGAWYDPDPNIVKYKLKPIT